MGVAEERFSEDALRMLRAVRFAGQLGFSIEEETRQAIHKLAPNIAKVSAERIQIGACEAYDSEASGGDHDGV